MKKIKVSEATGRVLDWMVAKCEGASPDALESYVDGLREAGDGDYSTDWAQGGPILSKLGAENGLQLTTHVTSTAAACGWRASCDFPNGFYFGETALIAAMRCYVASRLGNEVEVPEELG